MLIGSKIKLRDKRLVDAWNDYTWRTDPELAQLDAIPQLATAFAEYLSIYTAELYHPTPTRHPFAIETPDGKHIGNCSFYNIDESEGEAELGILIGNRNYWDKGYGTDATTTLVNYIFHHTNLQRIHLKTLESNQRAQRCFQKCGFKLCGHLERDGHSFILMEMYRHQWQGANIRGETKRGVSPSTKISSPSPYQGEGDKGDRVT